MITLPKQFGTGCTICQKAIDLANKTNSLVRFEFNGVWFVVDKYISIPTPHVMLGHVGAATKGDVYI